MKHGKAMLASTALTLLAVGPCFIPGAVARASADTSPDVETSILMNQDGMSQAAATAFFAAQESSNDTATSLSTQLNISQDNFAVDPSTGALIGYYTTPAEEQAMQNQGAQVVPVQYSAEVLAADANQLTAAIPASDTGFYSASVDVKNQKVDVTGTSAFFASADWTQASAGLPVSAQVQTTGPSVSVATPIPGNYVKTPGNNGWVFICSLGWVSQQAWVITAGHCTYDPYEANGITSLGRTVYDGSGAPFGTTANSSYHYNGVDYGRIIMYSGAGAAGTGYYANYAGGKNRIYSVARPIVGSQVCKYGTTTGVTCGQVHATNVIVNYNNGTRTTQLVSVEYMCTRPGDSGAPVAQYHSYSSGTAIGMVSGGNDPSCSTPFVGLYTYISIADDALRHYGATLNTATGSKQ